MHAKVSAEAPAAGMTLSTDIMERFVPCHGQAADSFAYLAADARLGKLACVVW